jgi:hypothetical protein
LPCCMVSTRLSRWYSEKTAIRRLNMRPLAVSLDCPSRDMTFTPVSFISSINDSKRATVRASRFHL